jgi:hypothetical protein
MIDKFIIIDKFKSKANLAWRLSFKAGALKLQGP